MMLLLGLCAMGSGRISVQEALTFAQNQLSYS